MRDLDQSGFGYQQTKVWLGPSLGWTMEHVQPAVTITDPGTYVVKPGDSLILIDCAGLVVIQLPDVRLWVEQPGYHPATAFKRSICIKDIGGHATDFDITITPFSTQRIDDIQQSMLISTAFALVNLVPLIDLTGWTVQSNVGGGGNGGGGGDVYKAGNNTFTGINTFLNTITVPTMAAADDSTNAASTAFVKAQGYLLPPSLVPYAPLDSPAFINTPTAPTPPTADNSTRLATTAYVKANLATYQPLDADLTALSAVTGSNDIYYRSGTSTWSPVVIGTNLTFTGGVLNATGGPAFITSVTAPLSVTTGVLSIDLSAYSTTAAIAAAYQPLDGDLTAIAALTGTNTIYYRSGTNTWTPVTIGANLTFTGGTLAATGGGGGAPTTAEYITASADATLSAERVLTNTASITWDFSTPGQAKANTAAGGGNVSNSGTPINSQYARWVDATHVEGVNPSTVRTDINAVNKLGDTMTGDLTISGTLPNLIIDSAGSGNLVGRHSGVDRWKITIGDLTSETGSNAGSNFAISRYSDAGGSLGNALSINRATGVVTIPNLANYQPLDGDLTALAGLTGTNTIYYRSGADTWSPVVIGANLTFSGGILSGGAGGGITFTASATAPSTPAVGDQWYDLSTGVLAVWINDGNSSQWVQIAPPTPVGIPGNFLPRDTTATIATGYTVSPYNGGTVSSGTFTPSAANGNYQYYTNNGAHTFATPATDSAIDILVTNGTTPGAITFSGYTVGANTGDALTTTVNHKFIISIRRINAISTYSIRALQ